MQRSLFSAVSGLRNHQTRMDVIGNNIANVNTTAFKSGRATFKESFSQVLSGASRPVAGQGGVNPLEVGMGMQLASIDTVFTQGNLETTGVPTDMAVQGNSFFVVGQGNQSFYTRAGNFQLDADGRLVSPTNGFVVQGRMATNGVLGGALTDIKLPAGQTTPAKATTQAGLSGNLDSSAPIITAADPTNPTDAELGSADNASSVAQTSEAVYDSLGVKHDLSMVAWKVAPDKWDFKVNVDGVATGTPSTFTGGSFTFKSDGTLDTATSTPTFPAISFQPTGNASAVSIKLDPGTGATGITSYASNNSALLRDQDGYTSGVLERTTVGRDGTIVGAFSNGTNQALAQVALADFNNPEGLEQSGDNMYTVSANSGAAVVGYSGSETSSTIASGALEMSNVDLAQEFTDMIITQKGFQANGKMITTSDDMLQTLIDIKR